MPGFSLPENLKPIMALQPRTTNGAVTATLANYISVKNCQRVFLLISLTQAAAHATVFTLERATGVGKIAVAPVGNVAITAAMMRWWSNIDCATLETLAERTAAVAVTADAGVTYQLHLVEFILDALGSGYDVVGFTVGSSGEATNFGSCTWLVQPKYATAVAVSPLIEAN
jgi:hypothetical protein